MHVAAGLCWFLRDSSKDQETTMRIEHVAVWTPNIEILRDFYCRHFGCTSSPRYENAKKGFASHFLTFARGARLELMQKLGVESRVAGDSLGLAHLALSVGSEAEVRTMTERLRGQGVAVIGEPRLTGDGCFESVVSDPDGNLIEITV
jgi:lactoylglutathione lyase